jgi:hypothetical protein
VSAEWKGEIEPNRLGPAGSSRRDSQTHAEVLQQAAIVVRIAAPGPSDVVEDGEAQLGEP